MASHAYELMEFSRTLLGYTNGGRSYRRVMNRRSFFGIPFASADVAIMSELTLTAAGLQNFCKS